MRLFSLVRNLSLTCNVVLLGLFLKVWCTPPQTSSSLHLPTQESLTQVLTTKKIAILSPALIPVVEIIENGFIKTLHENRKNNYKIRIFNSSGNKSLMYSQLEEILENSYDLIFTIGISATQMAKELTTKKNILIPIVFCAISDAVERNIIASEECSKNHVTGASALKVQSYEQGIALLFTLKPTIKTILLPYNPSAVISDNEFDKIEEMCKKRGAKIQKIEVFGVNEVIEKLSAFITTGDTLFVTRDSTIMGTIDAVVKLCNLHNVTVFASDLESTQKGAALGLGLDEAESGVHAARKAKLILEEGKKPSEIPVTVPNYQYALKINQAALKSQGLEISPEMMFLIKNSEIIHTP